MKAIILEDDPDSLFFLKHQISKLSIKVDVVGETESIQIALSLIDQHDPDIVFLDMEVEEDRKGFELLEILRDYRFQIIVTTGHSDRYVSASFDHNSAYVCVKPVKLDDLEKAVRRAKDRLVLTKNERSVDRPDFIAVSIMEKSRRREIIVPIESIVMVTPVAGRNQSKLITNQNLRSSEIYPKGDGYFVLDNINIPFAFLEEQLKGRLIRVSNRHLVNLQFVSHIESVEGRVLVLKTSESITNTLNEDEVNAFFSNTIKTKPRKD